MRTSNLICMSLENIYVVKSQKISADRCTASNCRGNGSIPVNSRPSELFLSLLFIYNLFMNMIFKVFDFPFFLGEEELHHKQKSNTA